MVSSTSAFLGLRRILMSLRNRTSERFSVTNVTGLLLGMGVLSRIHLTQMFYALLQKDLFKGM